MGKKTQTAEDFRRLFGKGKKHDIRKVATRLFGFQNMQETFSFIQALTVILQAKPPKNADVLKECVSMLQDKFANFPMEKMGKILEYYFCEFIPPFRERKKTDLPFDLVSTLGGSIHNNPRAAKPLMSTIVAIWKDEVLKVEDPGPKTKPTRKKAVINFVIGIISMAKTIPTWNNFLEGLEKDEKTRIVFQDLMRLIILTTPTEFINLRKPEHFKNPDISGSEVLISRAQAIKFGTARIVVPAKPSLIGTVEKLGIASRLCGVVIDETVDAKIAFRNFVKNFSENLAWYTDDFEDMWAQVENEPKIALFPGGTDCVGISIGPMLDIGFSKIQFNNDGFDFPAVRAIFWLRVGSMDFQIPIDLYWGDLSRYNDHYNDELFRRENTQKLLAYIALKAYWMFVCEKWKALKGKKSGNGGNVTVSNIQAHIRRPRMVKLPDEKNASPEACARAMQVFGQEPPKKFTFRKSHRWPRTGDEVTVVKVKCVDDLRTLFALSDDDLVKT